MERYEYLKLKLSNIPAEIISLYNITEKATNNGHVYVEIRRGMYGLPQAGLIANELLEKRLATHGYQQNKLVPGLWIHDWRPIQFTLTVNDFGVKYVGREHAEHLMAALEENYTITHDWKGTLYVGITLDWDYKNGQVHLSMPGYVREALLRFNHPFPTKK